MAKQKFNNPWSKYGEEWNEDLLYTTAVDQERSYDRTKVTLKRDERKKLDPNGGHVIDEFGNVIWRSENNPDNGFTWRYLGNKNISELDINEIQKLEDVELITEGKMLDEGRIVMNFVGSSLSYQEFINQQAAIAGVPVQIKIRPINSTHDPFAAVSKEYRNTDLRPFPKQNGWQHGGDMGSVIMLDQNNLEFIWNSKFGNTIKLPNIYDIRSILVHEQKHHSLQSHMFDVYENKMISYADINNITFQNLDDLKQILIDTFGVYDFEDQFARVWHYETDNNFVLPASRFLDPFVEVIAYAEQINHEDYEFTSNQLKIQHYKTLYEAPTNDETTLNYARKQGYGNDLYQAGSKLTISEEGRKFWNHANVDEYFIFIDEIFSPILEFRNSYNP